MIQKKIRDRDHLWYSNRLAVNINFTLVDICQLVEIRSGLICWHLSHYKVEIGPATLDMVAAPGIMSQPCTRDNLTFRCLSTTTPSLLCSSKRTDKPPQIIAPRWSPTSADPKNTPRTSIFGRKIYTPVAIRWGGFTEGSTWKPYQQYSCKHFFWCQNVFVFFSCITNVHPKKNWRTFVIQIFVWWKLVIHEKLFLWPLWKTNVFVMTHLIQFFCTL